MESFVYFLSGTLLTLVGGFWYLKTLYRKKVEDKMMELRRENWNRNHPICKAKLDVLTSSLVDEVSSLSRKEITAKQEL